MKVSELLNLEIPEIKVGSTVFVTRPSLVYSSYHDFEKRLGFSNCTTNDYSINNAISQKVIKGLKGTVLAKGRHSEKCNEILCIVETDGAFRFIISIDGLESEICTITNK